MYFLVLFSALLACAAGVPFNNAKPLLDGRIYGGNEIDITSHPYQVSLLYWGAYYYICAGSIVSPNWMVTLAVCVDPRLDISDLSVRSGSTYSNSDGTLHNVTRIIRHENYNLSNSDYDVALVQVSPAFVFSDSVQPITLECDTVPVGTDVVVSGWAATIEGPYSTTLRQVSLKIISDSVCNSAYASRGGITESMICAGDPIGGNGACEDYGGPLVANNKLVGIFSWRWGCGDPQYPDVYTKVSAVRQWIVNNAGP